MIFLDALKGQNRAGRPPVWFMRQAGRALSSYRKLREAYTLDELFKTPELAAAVTLLPQKELGVDALILFSDILVVYESLGYTLSFKDKPEVIPGGKPQFPDYVRKTIEHLKSRTLPLIGFCGGPFTVFSFLFKEDRIAKALAAPTKMLDAIADATSEYIEMQIQAGVDAFQIFDTAVGQLTEEQFDKYCYPYMKRLLKTINGRVPTILFCRGFASRLAELGPTCIGLPENVSLTETRKQISSSIALQGNLDPQLLRGEKEPLLKAVHALLNETKGCNNFIFNLGHGVPPDTKEGNLQAIVTSLTCSTKS